MSNIIDSIRQFLQFTGFANMSWLHLVMICAGILFIFLARRKDWEPMLLVPIGFGIIIGNIKHDFAYIYAFMWGDQTGPTHVLRQCIKAGSAGISSSYKMGEKTFNGKLEDFLEKFK